jgi:hypothetical protein
MILTETLKVLRMKEMETGHLLKDALSLQRSCVSSNFHFLRNSDAFPLLTVNSKARIKWGTVFVEEMFDFFKIADDENGPTDPLFLVTIADKFHFNHGSAAANQFIANQTQTRSGINGLIVYRND